jgi:hypothetical protein
MSHLSFDTPNHRRVLYAPCTLLLSVVWAVECEDLQVKRVKVHFARTEKVLERDRDGGSP